MSAFDIAGAVVWTPLAVLFWGAAQRTNKQGDKEATAIGFFLTILCTLAAAFCIARLFGARL